MSEAITQACYLCRGTGQCVSNGLGGFSDCARCSATGRVPDAEATLRAQLAETEQARHEARYYANEVAAERDNLQSRLNQAEHAAKMLTAERDRAQAESHTRLLQRLDAEKEARYCRALVDGKAEERTQAAELQARQANDRVRVLTDALKETEAERDAMKAQRDELREAARAAAKTMECEFRKLEWHDSRCGTCATIQRLKAAIEAAR